MAEIKKKGDADATANLKRTNYTKLIGKTQDGTHVRRLLKYLYEHDAITPMECFQHLNNTRISSTVSILRHEYGVPVKMVKVTKNGKSYGVYSIDWEAFHV